MTSFVRIGVIVVASLCDYDKMICPSIIFIIFVCLIFQAKFGVGTKDNKRASIFELKPSSRSRTKVSNGSCFGKSNPGIGKICQHE